MPVAPSDAAPSAATVRTYRRGRGDCHLVTLHGAGGKAYRILVDGGGAPADAIVDDAVNESGGRIDLLAITQADLDAPAGPVLAAAASGQLAVGEVWMGWTADPEDGQAMALRHERMQALDNLRLAGARMELLGGAAQAAAIGRVLADYRADGHAPAREALDALRRQAVPVRYCDARDAPVELAGLGARMHVLAPLRGAAYKEPRGGEDLRLVLDNFTVDLAPALRGQAGQQPFSSLYAIPEATARGMAFFQEHYWEAEPWRRIDTAWMAGAGQLALALDTLAGDASLALAIDVDKLGVLLFLAGAQLDSRRPWNDLHWTVDAKAVTCRDLLARTVYLKAGSHGAFDASLFAAELASMPGLRVATIPVDRDRLAVEDEAGLVRPMARALAGAMKGKGYALRTDQAPPPAALHEGVRATDDYFEVQLVAG